MRNIWTLWNNLILQNDLILRNTAILRNHLMLGKTKFSGILAFCGRPDLTEYHPISSSSFVWGHVQYITETGCGQERTVPDHVTFLNQVT